MPATPAAGIVLCGGGSTRMGTAKAGLEWHGSTLLRRVAGLVARAVDGPVVVVRAAGQELPALPAAFEVVDDEVAGQGPLRGLATGLDAIGDRAEAAFVASTDLPLLHPRFATALLAALEPDVDLAVPVLGGRAHPLCAAYRVAPASAAARALLDEGTLRLTTILERLRTRELDAAALLADRELAAADPELASVRNVNTPADYTAARRRR